MKITIKGRELEMHYSLRILINYEEITGKSLDFSDMNSISNLVKLFYSAVLAALQYAKQPLDITYDDFLDFIDSEGNYDILREFGEWYTNTMLAHMDVENQKKGKTQDKKEKKSDLKLEKNV